MKKLFTMLALLVAFVAGSFAYEVRVGKDVVFTDVKKVVIISGLSSWGSDMMVDKDTVLAPPMYKVVLKDGSEWRFCGEGGFFTDAPVEYSNSKDKYKNK